MVAPTVKLNSGYEMPLVGFGLWKVTENCADTVYNAIKAGYRLFDGACDYGNEKEAGQGVARAIKEGIVKREDLFLVSKLWSNFHGEHAEEGCRISLDLWGLDYFDLYIIHFPLPLEYVDPKVKYPPTFTDDNGKVYEPAKIPLHKTWAEMEKLQKKGLAKSIGVSNYNAGLVWEISRYANTMPATLQIEHHPYLTQEDLIKLAKRHGITITAYSSFGPMSYIEMGVEKQNAKNTPPLLQHDTIKSIADKHGKTPAQVLLRWATQRDIAVIPKSNDPKRLAQNLDVCSFDLSEDELKKISGLNQNIRFNSPPSQYKSLHEHIQASLTMFCFTLKQTTASISQSSS